MLIIDVFALGPWEIPKFICHTHVATTLLKVNTQLIQIFPAWNVHKRHQLIEPVFKVFKEETEALELLTMLRS